VLLSSGLIDLAIARNTLIGGDDFKSGQTKMKSVLVDFLVGAGIKVHCCYTNVISWVLFLLGQSILCMFCKQFMHRARFICQKWRNELIFSSVLLMIDSQHL